MKTLLSTALALALTVMGVPTPIQAQSLGIQPPQGFQRQPPQGAKTLGEIIGLLPTQNQVRTGAALLRIVPTTREGRHSHQLGVLYYPSYGACEEARRLSYEDSSATTCLPIAVGMN